MARRRTLRRHRAAPATASERGTTRDPPRGASVARMYVTRVAFSSHLTLPNMECKLERAPGCEFHAPGRPWHSRRSTRIFKCSVKRRDHVTKQAKRKCTSLRGARVRHAKTTFGSQPTFGTRCHARARWHQYRLDRRRRRSRSVASARSSRATCWPTRRIGPSLLITTTASSGRWAPRGETRRRSHTRRTSSPTGSWWVH